MNGNTTEGGPLRPCLQERRPVQHAKEGHGENTSPRSFSTRYLYSGERRIQKYLGIIRGILFYIPFTPTKRNCKPMCLIAYAN